jgi:hypothetical protein
MVQLAEYFPTYNSWSHRDVHIEYSRRVQYKNHVRDGIRTHDTNARQETSAPAHLDYKMQLANKLIKIEA